MFNNFQEGIRSPEATDLRPSDWETPNSEIPSMDDLKSKLENILMPQEFPTVDEKPPVQPDIQLNNSIEADVPTTITLDDGTVVELPKSPDSKMDMESTGEHEKHSDTTNCEAKPTRELTDEEKTNLQETLGWTDKQIAKCTIDEDGVIHYRTDREDMEGKTGENGVRYERKTIDIHGVKVEGVFPIFESVCDVQLPEDLEQASNARQFKECNKQLQERVENDPELRNAFTDEQLEEIEDGDTPSGYVWHHNEETGKMQLVKDQDHDRTQGGAAHTGGKALWGGGYSDHDATESPEKTHSQSSKEVE